MSRRKIEGLFLHPEWTTDAKCRTGQKAHNDRLLTADAEFDLALKIRYALANEQTAKRIAAGLASLLLPGAAEEAEIIILGLLEKDLDEEGGGE